MTCFLDLVLVPRGPMLIGVMVRWKGGDEQASTERATELAGRVPAAL